MRILKTPPSIRPSGEDAHLITSARSRVRTAGSRRPRGASGETREGRVGRAACCGRASVNAHATTTTADLGYRRRRCERRRKSESHVPGIVSCPATPLRDARVSFDDGGADVGSRRPRAAPRTRAKGRLEPRGAARSDAATTTPRRRARVLLALRRRHLRILRILLLLLREDEVPREREHDLVRGEVPQRDEAAPAAVAEVSERHLALERRVVRGPREPAEDARRGVVGRVVGPGRRPDAAARRRRRRRAGRRRARRRARSRRDARWRRRHRRAHASGSARARPGSDRETDLKTHTHTI